MRCSPRSTALLLLVGSGLLYGQEHGPRSDSTAASAKPEPPDPYGEWKISVQSDDQKLTTLLVLSRGAGGRPRGQWIGTWRLAPLQDVSFEGARLRFAWGSGGRDGESAKQTFEGRIEDDSLAGTLTTARGDQAVRGERIRPLPEIVGDWAVFYTDDRISSTLSVRRGEDGELTATWKSDTGEKKLRDFSYEDGNVSFTQNGSRFEFRLARSAALLDGSVLTERGDIPLVASRIGTALAGTWELDVTSERGTHAHRLRILADLSGWYNAMPIRLSVGAKAEGNARSTRTITSLAGRPLRFETSDGDREFVFEGSVVGGELRGEVASPRGNLKVSGRRREHAGNAASRKS